MLQNMPKFAQKTILYILAAIRRFVNFSYDYDEEETELDTAGTITAG